MPAVNAILEFWLPGFVLVVGSLGVSVSTGGSEGCVGSVVDGVSSRIKPPGLLLFDGFVSGGVVFSGCVLVGGVDSASGIVSSVGTVAGRSELMSIKFWSTYGAPHAHNDNVKAHIKIQIMRDLKLNSFIVCFLSAELRF